MRDKSSPLVTTDAGLVLEIREFGTSECAIVKLAPKSLHADIRPDAPKARELSVLKIEVTLLSSPLHRDLPHSRPRRLHRYFYRRSVVLQLRRQPILPDPESGHRPTLRLRHLLCHLRK